MFEGSGSNYKVAAKLILDEPRNVYYSGQVLKGWVECELTQPMTYSAININFTGEANVFWSESETEEYNGVRREVNVGYKGQETYFNTMICISGGTAPITLPPGSHRVPFEFQIPHTAPSSFAGDRGSVTYKVTAYVEYPDRTRDRDQLEREFEVVAPLDLNIGEDIKSPIDLEFEELVYTCCCCSSPMTVRIHIPASGFCPGQAIPITISAENQSSTEIKKIIFELIKKECYHSKQPKSDYIPPDEILESIKTGPILANTKRDIHYEMVVPSFIAPNLQNCNIIDIGYFINVTIKLSGCNDDLSDENEICLGLVPLASLVENYEHPLKSDLPQAAVPDPNYILPPPVQNMSYQTNAMQTSAAYNTNSHPNSGHFPNVTPYPPSAFPYPPNNVPYSTNPSPFPTHATPYPPDNQNHPHPGIPMGNLKTGQIGFVSPIGANPPYPGSNPPYPGANPSFPGANPSFPGAHPSFPGANPSFPGAHPPYPGANPHYPTGGAPYSSNQPVNGFQPPYPVHSSPSAPPS